MNAPTQRLGASTAVAFAVALAVGACSDGRDSAATDATSATTRVDETPGAEAGAGDASTTTVVATDPDLGTPIVAVEVARLEQPVALVARRGTDDLFAAEKAGVVRRLVPQTDGSLEVVDEPVLDIRDSVTTDGLEQGLLGLTFSPDGSTLFVSYSAAEDDGASVVESYPMAENAARRSGRTEILRLDQPAANHNGGNIAFGPDGFLYLGFGDGGNQGDPDDNGQDPTTLLATMLRLDVSEVDGDTNYRIPPDNPFADGADGRPEVWAYGVRNPWRWSFDRATGDLWIGDVGGNRFEEIDVLPAATGGGRGANLGWSLREGGHDTEKGGTRPENLIEPIYEYDHDDGISVVGGFVYRGPAIPGLQGAYLYSDWGSSAIRAIVADGSRLVEQASLETTGDPITQVASFGETNEGELYVVSLEGLILALRPA